MEKKILVIPDVHGRYFWKEPVKKYFDTVDRVVFLGDYLDPYEGEEGLADDIFENMMEIVRHPAEHSQTKRTAGTSNDVCCFVVFLRDLQCFSQKSGTRFPGLSSIHLWFMSFFFCSWYAVYRGSLFSVHSRFTEAKFFQS